MDDVAILLLTSVTDRRAQHHARRVPSLERPSPNAAVWLLQRPPVLLLPLDRLEQRLEVALTEALQRPCAG